MRKMFFFALRTSSLVLLLSCAQMQVPGGGPRDTAAPLAVRYLPDSAAVNFTGRDIRIIFNENIVLRDVAANLLISPPLNEMPELKLVKNHILDIHFKEELKANTTYNLYFGKAIADVHEGNVADGFSYIFSTGPALDSLQLFGSVSDAFTGASLKNVAVMLYAQHADSLPFTVKPGYFSRSSTDGSFRVQNLRAGTYKVMAFTDANRNFLCEPEEEQMGFPDSLLVLEKNTKMNLRLYAEKKKKQFVKKSAVTEPGKVIIVLNKPCPDLKINVLSVNPPLTRMQMNEGADTAFLFVAGWEKDSLELLLSSDQDLWKEKVFLRTAGLGKPKLKVQVIYSSGTFQDPYAPVILRFNYPIDTFKFSGMMDREELSSSDSSALEFSIEGNTVEVRPVARSSSLVPRTFLWDFDTEHDILLHPACFTGFGKLLSDTIHLTFRVKEEKYYGSLEFKVQAGKEAVILELLNEKGGVMHRLTGTGDLTIRRNILPPGKYRARLIYDKNGNGIWDPGDYNGKRQPERVVYSPGLITLRSDWEVQEVWKVE